MFALSLVFLALLASSAAQAGISRYIQGRWIVDDPHYDDFDGRPLTVEEERMWPESPPEVVELVTVVEGQTLLTTPEPYAMEEQDSGEGEEDSAVWKIVLVVTVLLVSVVGSLSVAYYMCVWRGGRIHYQTQKEDYS